MGFHPHFYPAAMQWKRRCQLHRGGTALQPPYLQLWEHSHSSFTFIKANRKSKHQIPIPAIYPDTFFLWSDI